MQDLSEMARGSILMNSSMQAGGTVSVRPEFAPAGSESEASADVPVHSQPNIDLGPNNDRQLDTKVNDAGALHQGALSWKKLK